jgi:hypothetical protein
MGPGGATAWGKAVSSGPKGREARRVPAGYQARLTRLDG